MIFDPELAIATETHRWWFRFYEMVYVVVDFSAALLFVIGSVLFFYPEWVYAGTWFFLVGSIFFAFRPTIKLIKEFHLQSLPRNGEKQT